MPDFFPKSSELTIKEIAALTRAEPRAGVPLGPAHRQHCAA